MIKKVLLVEDNPDVTYANRLALEMEGYCVLEADTLAKGRELVERENPDLIILDIKMPDGNGLEYCRELRGVKGINILFLSALNTKKDTIAGLHAGGDDYMTKPYLIDELLARVEALLRRSRADGIAEPLLRLGSLELNFFSNRALLNGKDLMLEPKEFALLGILSGNQDRFITAYELYKKVWGMEPSGDVRTVKVRISRIRQKLGKEFEIVTGRGEGYRLLKKDAKIKRY